MSAESYDALILGSGQAGGPLASALVTAGKRTALIERVHIGGTCINEGCSPTKTMIASARVAYLVNRARDYGVETTPGSVDLPTVLQRKAGIVTSFREGSTSSIEAGGVDIIRGEATFTDPNHITVIGDAGERTLEADLIFINTGARPAMPPVEGLDRVDALTSTTIMEVNELPEHLLVLGGGVIGLEFGQMFRRFGSRVTIVQALPKLMNHEDPDVADEVALILRQDGIDILLESKATRAWQGEDGSVCLEVEAPDGKQTLQGSHLLVAAGRAPNTEALNLAAAGVKTDAHGFVQVNDQLETGVAGIYALGDVAGSPQFTHMSYDDFRIVRDNLLHGGNRSRSDRLVPYTMFTDPQLGRVGITETQARAEGRKIQVACIPMTHVARALEVDEPRGLIKAVVDAETGKILGCAVLGLEGGEIMAMIEIAMMGGLPYTTLRDGIFAHPTLAESLNTLFGSLD